MLDSETVIRATHSDKDSRTSVSMKTQGCELVLFFDDPGRQGPLRELRLLPDTKELEPRVLRQFAPQSPLFLQYARAAMTDNEKDWVRSLSALREIGATRRGLGDEFYRRIAMQYDAIVASDKGAPIKALGEMNHVVISTASRWVKEARRRGYIKEADDA